MEVSAEIMEISSADGGSNAIMLPSKKKGGKMVKKSQSSAKVETVMSKKMSNSQKRKLKKLEEEKAKEHLLAKSFEILEKCKIDEDVYKLMRSSKSIGQADTSKGKRRIIMNYSKAGLEVPYGDWPSKRKHPVENPSETDFNDEDDHPTKVSDSQDIIRPCVAEATASSNGDVSTLQVSPDTSYCKVKVSANCESVAKPLVQEVGHGHHDEPLLARDASPKFSPIDKQEIINKVDEVSITSKGDIHGTKPIEDCSSHGSLGRPTVVHVTRPEEVESKRKELPIVMMEQEIMEAINDNISVIICGETGCGKTTQVPQFLYEAGYGSKSSTIHSGVIGVTQPRRVAVLATAKRVAFELGVRLGREVGFQVRYDKKIGENCSIKFMTDGILLREVQNDFLLKRYSVLILDEAHERSLNTDILIGMLSRVIMQRQIIYQEQQKKIISGETLDPQNRIFPLKLILMSATLRVEDFSSGRRIFREPPPVIEVPTRQYPVISHFSKRTEIVDYIGQAYKKVMLIHKKLPPGGILVFVTGQREVEYLCSKLRKASKVLVHRSSRSNDKSQVAEDTNLNEIIGCDMKEITEALDVDRNTTQQQTDRFSSCEEPQEQLNDEDSDHSYHSDESDSDLEFENDGEVLGDPKNHGDNGNGAEFLGEQFSLEALKASFASLAGKTELNNKSGLNQGNPNPVSLDECPDNSKATGVAGGGGRENNATVGPLCVLPLYAMLPAAAQLRVFSKVKEGERLVVVATNVAETSLTIPGVKYVVDTGREKVKNYNSSNGVESYEIQWISKASAAQRAGRAGRTGPGHCYRLYSSAVFSNQFSDFSCAEILKIPADGVVLLMKSMGISKVANFPFPTPPDAAALVEAKRCLKALKALDKEGRLTALGKTMAHYPMSPRHSRMLLTAIEIMNRDKQGIRLNLVLGYAVAAASALSLSNPFRFRFEGTHNNSEQDEKSNSLTDDERALEKQQKLMRKKWKEAAKLTRAKFSSIKSDALTVSYALQCFELSQNPSKFCASNILHLKTMEEMSKLRKQLLQLVFNQSRTSLQEEYFWTHGTLEDIERAWKVPCDKNPLTLAEEEILLQAICAGWVDRIAKRVNRSKQIVGGDDDKVNSAPYQAAMAEERVYLHRWSSVAKVAPEFVVYSELLHTKRPYIHGASSVKSEWLVRFSGSNMCAFSAPLTDPKPGYDFHSDQVYCLVIPYFGPHSWELPYHKVPINDVMQRVTVFAYALLDGQVLPCLKSARQYMAAQPSSILKPEALGQKRIGNLLGKLKSRSRTIDCCATLREVWKENPVELHEEIRCWFQAGFHDHFDKLWMNMQNEAFLAPQDRFHQRSRKRKVATRKQ